MQIWKRSAFDAPLPRRYWRQFLKWNNLFSFLYQRNYTHKTTWSHQKLYDVIIKDQIFIVFLSTETALRIFMTLMVTNCSGERSLSQLKRIKNELRTTMLQAKLSSLLFFALKATCCVLYNWMMLLTNLQIGWREKHGYNDQTLQYRLTTN